MRLDPTLPAALTLAALLAAPAAGQGKPVAVKGGRVITMAGAEHDEATVLIRDGVIAAVGPKVEIPYDAVVIDAAGKVVFPGMVLPHTSRGLDRANERLSVTPFVDVVDSLDPSDLVFENALRDGMTTLHVIQGNDTVVAGVGRVVHPLGMTVESMTVEAASAIKIAVAGKEGYDRIQQRAELREVFAELDDYLDALAEQRFAEEEQEAGREVTVPPAEAREKGRPLLRDADVDDKHRRLFQLVNGRLDAFVYVDRAQDVAFALDLARERGFLARAVFVIGDECHKAVDAFKAAGRPVILPIDLVHREKDRATGEVRETFLPKVFADAGVPFAFQTNPRASFAERFLWYQAARAVRGGVERDVALAAITTTPAAMLGLGERLGALAPGRDGDLLILTGDPLAIETQVEAVLIGGEQVYERAKDHRLRKLMGADDAGDKAADEPKVDDDAQDPEDTAGDDDDAKDDDAPKGDEPKDGGEGEGQ